MQTRPRIDKFCQTSCKLCKHLEDFANPRMRPPLRMSLQMSAAMRMLANVGDPANVHKCGRPCKCPRFCTCARVVVGWSGDPVRRWWRPLPAAAGRRSRGSSVANGRRRPTSKGRRRFRSGTPLCYIYRSEKKSKKKCEKICGDRKKHYICSA